MSSQRTLLLNIWMLLLIHHVISTEFNTFSQIVDINITLYINGSMEEKLQIASNFSTAFHEYGFVRLIDDSISRSLYQNLLSNTQKFF